MFIDFLDRPDMRFSILSVLGYNIFLSVLNTDFDSKGMLFDNERMFRDPWTFCVEKNLPSIR